MADITKLSASKLEALYNQRFRKDAAQCQACIAAGLGNWTPRERDAALRGEREASPAELEVCKSWLDSAMAFREVCDEQDRRKRYHGSLKPIRAVA